MKCRSLTPRCGPVPHMGPRHSFRTPFAFPSNIFRACRFLVDKTQALAYYIYMTNKKGLTKMTRTNADTIFEYLNVPKRRVTAQTISGMLNLSCESVNANLAILFAEGRVIQIHVKGRDGIDRLMWAAL